ncbi:DUF6635 family protein [Paracoccus sp. KR1-242]|uniref:DUF6635 family protein n=1 Tax=Paracoccus sp. KR1-242 TaxID=3410028 RepID=UPI003C0E43EF
MPPARPGSAAPAPADTRPMTRRESEIGRFVADRYGIRGTLALHRAAIGADLLRAPANVALSPVFLLLRFVAMMLRLCGARGAASWLDRRQIFLTTDVARRIESDLTELLTRLDSQGIAPRAPAPLIQSAIRSYAETRNAVSEITTSIIVLLSGFLIFYQATPGVLSLATPIAEMRAHSHAVADFALGSWAGGMWYSVFPTQFSTLELVLTGIVLSVLAALVTTFAGIVADPVQVWSGIHKRRLLRLMARLDRQQDASGLGREHVLARLGDLGDLASSIWRAMR